ncbi:MAG: glycosyltransferase family 2 protein [Cypionkella sp.]
MAEITVAVFSYNRGAYLEFCLASIARNLPQARVVVYDDLSDDPATVAVLAALRVPLVQPTAVARAQHGGLYVNMRRALAEVTTPYLLFLQDDMQIVRQVTVQDIATIEAMFAADEACGFISPLFMKAQYARKLRGQYQAAPLLRSYVCAPEIAREAMRFAFADVTLAHVPRLRAAGFDILDGEGANEVQAEAMFSQMPLMADPFAFYCPEVPTFRNRKRPFSGRIARVMRRAGGLGFVDMTAAEVDALRHRDLSVWPFAEDFLTPENPQVRRPFVFQDFQGPLALRVLSRVEYLLLSGGRRLRRLRAKWGI